MRMPRIFTPQPLATGLTLALEEQASIHLGRVLRMQTGQKVELFNGQGASYIATIIELGKKQLNLAVEESITVAKPSPLMTEIALAVSKGDKMDWIVQKATELGVNRIIPLISTRTDVRLDAKRRQKKLEQWQQIMISACEQCGRNDLVEIQAITKIEHYFQQCQAEYKFICHPVKAQSLAAFKHVSHASFCFGSEGGLTDEEIAQAESLGFSTISLGPRVLRAETAPLAALAIAQSLWGDFTP